MPIIQTLGAALLRGARALFGGAAATTAAGRTAVSTARAVGVLGAGTAVGIGAAAAVGGLADAITQQGGQVIRTLSGGRLLVRTPDGGIGIVTRMGRLVNPTVLVPAGSGVPPGGTLVSISGDGALIGFTIKRKRRPFASELRRVRSVLSSVNALHRSMQPKKRRSS